MQSKFVSRFVADSLVQQAYTVIQDDEENVEVHIAPKDIDYKDVELYVTEQFGCNLTEAVMSVDDDFDGINRESEDLVAFYWEA